MAFSYNKLWKLLIDKKINKITLRDSAGITRSTLARLSKEQTVSMDVLGRICKELKCDISDIVEYIHDDEGGDEE